jgi:serine/threonine protein kinase
MADTSKIYGSRWRVLRPLGQGGQGRVYEVEDIGEQTDPSGSLLEERMKSTLREATAAVYHAGSQAAMKDLIQIIQDVSRGASLAATSPHGALKELLPFEEAVNANTARQRLAREMTAMAAVKHPNLIAMLDSNANERWFVTTYYDQGSLESNLKKYQGRALDALKAIRGLVEGIATLHKAGLVHRDVKPGNVYIAGDERLVLGDFGLVFESDHADRVTETFENVGTRDFMPPWAMGVRIDEIKPDFDVFALSKLLWTMISGKPRMQLWYWNDPRFDLTIQFPEDAHVARVNRIFSKTLVQFANDCLPTATELLSEVDEAIDAIETSTQLPSTSKPMRCRFCGIGTYEQFSGIQADGFADSKDRRHTWRCNKCGHLESFFWRGGQAPEAWI